MKSYGITLDWCDSEYTVSADTRGKAMYRAFCFYEDIYPDVTFLQFISVANIRRV